MILAPLCISITACFPFWKQEDEVTKIDRLIRTLGAETIEERDESSKQLRALGPTAIGRLRRALKHPDPEIRARVRPVLRHMDRRFVAQEWLGPSLTREFPILVERILQERTEDATWTKAFLLALDQDKYPGLRAQDLRTLEWRAMAGSRPQHHFDKMHSGKQVHTGACSIFEERKDARALVSLIVQDKKSTPKLIRILEVSGSENLIIGCIAELGRRRATEAIGPLIKCLSRHETSDEHFRIRLSIAETLGKLKATRAIPHLKPLLKDKTEEVRSATEEALEAITRTRPLENAR